MPGRGEALIELTDARDAAAAFCAAARHAEQAHGRAFNISGGAPRRFRDIANHVFSAMGRDVRLVPLGAGLATAIGGAMESIAKVLPGQPEPPFTRYGAMALGWSQTFDLRAAQETLGWSPAYSPEQAIAWALESFTHG